MNIKTTVSLKRLIAAIVLSAAMAFPAAAPLKAQQEISPEHLALARQYVDLSDNAQVFEAKLVEIGVATMRLLIQQDPALLDPLRDIIEVAVNEYAERKGELMNQFARIYASRFSIDELDEIVAFYETEAGSKLLRQNAAINRDLNGVINVWEQNTRREFLSRVRNLLREEGYDV